MRFDDLRAAQSFAVLADLFPDEVSSRQLLQDCGIRPGQLRPFGQLSQDMYWREAVQQIEYGKFASIDVSEFVTRALSLWPGNEHLRSLVAAGGRPAPQTDRLRVLCLSAGPSDQERLRLEAEHREILMATRHGRRPVTVVLHPATQVEDIALRLLDAWPDVVHFSGHGGPHGELVLEDAQGYTRPVAVGEVAGLFSAVKPLRAVVLNSCYTGGYSQALRSVADVVIGSPQPVHDDCAVLFARLFYRSLSEGLDLRAAFDITLAQMSASGCPPHEMLFDGPAGGR
jgi:hypothetical protein